MADQATESAIHQFEYIPSVKVVVCKQHQYGLRDLKRHLLEHHGFSRELRDAVVERHAGLDIVRPEDASLPTDRVEPFDCLQEPQRAFHCGGWEGQHCSFISINRRAMSRHCNQHGWRSSSEEREHWSHVAVQSFCPTSQSPRWFVVGVRTDSDSETDTIDAARSVDPTQQQAIIQDFRRLDDRRKEELEIVDAAPATDVTGWWKKTGWVEHLKGSNKRHLAHAARLPGQDEAGMKRVGVLVDMLVEDGVKGLMLLPPELRRWLRSVKMAEVDPRPMGRLQNKDSQDRYATYVKRLVCYALRVLESVDGWQPVDAESNAEGEGDLLDGDEVVIVDADQISEEPDPMADARRLFKWTDGQKDRGRELLDSIERDASEGEQLKALLAFVETFIFNKVYHQPFDCPTVHFLAVMGIDEENDRLRTGNEYSYRVAGLVYCFRVLALQSLLPTEQRECQGPAEFEVFLEKRKEYLADGSMSAMSTMISLLAYGKYLAMNHGNSGSIFWEKNNRVMKLHGMRIVMDKVRHMVDRAIGDAEDLLWERLLWTEGSNRFEMDLDALEDDMTFRKRGSYFVTNGQNRLGSTWEKKTLTWMLASRRGRKMQKDGTWHFRRVREYLRELDKFRLLLLFCVHITSGQPARGPEVLSLRYKNGYLQDRNIFVLDGQVMVVTRYHKTQSQWDVPKAVPRFLPWRVGQLMCVYLTYAQPLMERLSVAIGHGCGWSEHIWADAKGAWETPKLTSILKRRTGEDLGVTLGTLDYRHAAVGMGRRFVGDEFARGYQAEMEEVDEPEIETDDPLEISAGRGSAIGVNRYAVPSDIVKHLSERNIQTFRPLSESWHRFLALHSRKDVEQDLPVDVQTPSVKRRRVTGGLATPAPSSEGGDVVPRLRFISTVSSAGHSSGIQEIARPSSFQMTPPTTVTPASCAAGNVPSSPPLISSTSIPETLASSSPPPSTAAVTFERPDNAQRLRAVRRALGKPETAAITYRSVEQEMALNRIMDVTDSALVVVLPTGGGKTLLFTAVACLDDPGMIIVVIPYRRLMDETVNDTRALRIDCSEWTYGTEDPATIVFVSADRLSRGFFDYAARMQSKGLLRRIYVDECHLAITAHSWRPKVAELSRLRGVGVPLVMLTATAPVWMESDLEATLSSTVSTSWIRASTARKTTKYTVDESIADGELMEEAVRRCKNLVAQLKRRERMVSYCRSTAECEELAGKLDCGLFYAGRPNNPEALKKWLAEGGIIVASTALGTGVSYPGVMLVVHVGLPYGLIDFSQESGRAGRGGEQVDSLVLLEQGWEKKEDAGRRRRRKIWDRDESAMVEFVKTRECRRLVLGEHFDRGEPVDCETGDMARCDRCCSGITDRQRSESRAAHEQGVVTDALDQLSGGCVVCWVAGARGGARDWQHDGRDCQWRESVPVDDGGQLDVGELACGGFRETIRYLDAGHACHRCGISQRLCDTGEEQGTCQWPHTAIPLLRLALACGTGRNIVRKAGYEGEMGDWGEYALWLGQVHCLRLWGEAVSNSMVVLSEFLVFCAQERASKGEMEGGLGVEEEETEEGEEGREDDDDDDDDEVTLRERARGSEEVQAANDDGMHGPDDEIEEAEGIARLSRVHETEIGPQLSVERIRQLLDGWKGVCVICRARGRSSRDHTHWKECQAGVADKAAMEEAMKTLEAVRFQSFSGCHYCQRPQAVCELWNRTVNGGGWAVFKKRQGAQCSYGAWLMEGAAVLLALKAKDGLKDRRAAESCPGAFVKEMGRKDRRGEVEFNGMFAYFYRWAW
jgi:hypothetical protein